MALGITLDRAHLLVVVTAEINDCRLGTDRGSTLSERQALAIVAAADAATTDNDRGRLALFLTVEDAGERRTRKVYLHPDAHELAYAREQALAAEGPEDGCGGDDGRLRGAEEFRGLGGGRDDDEDVHDRPRGRRGVGVDPAGGGGRVDADPEDVLERSPERGGDRGAAFPAGDVLPADAVPEAGGELPLRPAVADAAGADLFPGGRLGGRLDGWLAHGFRSSSPVLLSGWSQVAARSATPFPRATRGTTQS